ncbi:MAG: type II secretion system F family protein [Lachnospiraceae bacterium]|nr:type II secretion system F family protein [Lachnospiraceae bacterium]
MDYRTYRPDKAWIVREIIKIVLICTAVGYLFFKSAISVIFIMPSGYFIWKRDIKNSCEKRKKILSREFKDMLISLSGNLNAGYSLERAFYKTYQDLKKNGISYQYIIEELELILHGLEYNNRIEELIMDMAVRSGVEDIKDFSEMVTVSKIYGGNMVSVIRQTSNNISEKQMVEDEIETIIAAKKLEGKIMIIMPFLIILYMSITNRGYMDVIYYTLIGKGVMAVSLVIIMAAVVAIDKIVKIEV